MKLSEISSKSVRVTKLSEVSPEPIVEGEVSRRIITKFREGSERFSIAIVSFKKGVLKEEGENDKDNAGYIIEGNLILSWDGGSAEISEGCAFYVPAGKRVTLDIRNDSRILAVVSPPRI